MVEVGDQDSCWMAKKGSYDKKTGEKFASVDKRLRFYRYFAWCI